MSKRTFVVLTYGLLFILGIAPGVIAGSQTDTIKVVCVGNSITEGWMTSNPVTDNYAAQTGILLGSGWSVKNAGVSGRTMLRNGDYPIWNEQKFKDGLAFNPNIVTICLGTNDSKSWNWDSHKDEFVGDYNAMIDTFRSLPSHPVVWLCLPLPAFRDTLGIRDSIITTDIIPMIQQVAAAKSCPIIDFNTMMKSHADVVPDGIHPNTIGSAIMAEFLYSTLTGNPIVHVNDENCAAGKPVTVSGSIDSLVYGGANLVDADTSTCWITKGFPSEAVIDLGTDKIIDLFQVDFGTAGNTGYQFRIETATSAGAYTTAVDLTARTDSAAIILKKIDSLQVRFVRLTITGAARPKGDTVIVSGFRILKANGGGHAPIIILKKISASKTYARYSITLFRPDGVGGAMIFFKRSSMYGLSAVMGFKPSITTTIASEYIQIGTVNKYYAVSFVNGVETVSDTITVDTNPTAIGETESPAIPSQVALLPAYPNPFNPSTTISFTLPSKSFVMLKIFDIMGREVATLVSGQLPAGQHSRQWNAVNMPSGIYFCRLQAGLYIETRRLVLLK